MKKRAPKVYGNFSQSLRQKDRAIECLNVLLFVRAGNFDFRLFSFDLKHAGGEKQMNLNLLAQATVLDNIGAVLKKIDDFVWGIPLIVLILAGGLFLTARLGFLQIRHLPKALRFMVKNEEGGSGEVSSFGALCTAMSATIGTGNIVGVATALVTGGPGALFWMWIAALFGMATKYSEGLLAVKYRVVDENGHALG